MSGSGTKRPSGSAQPKLKPATTFRNELLGVCDRLALIQTNVATAESILANQKALLDRQLLRLIILTEPAPRKSSYKLENRSIRSELRRLLKKIALARGTATTAELALEDQKLELYRQIENLTALAARCGKGAR